MKAKWLVLFVFLFVFFIGLKSSSTGVSANEVVTPTPTIGNPNFVFNIGYASSSRAAYAPRKGEICKIWSDNSSGYFGAIRPGNYNKAYLFTKFTSDSVVSLEANNVECEFSSEYSSEDRLNWYTTHQTYKATYTINNSKAVYVDGASLSIVTLTNTVTPSITPTSTVTETPTPTSAATPNVTDTSTATATATFTSTPSRTASYTATETETMTATNSRTATSTATVTETPTATPALLPDKIVPINVSALHIPKAGHICYGQVVGSLRSKVVEFVIDFQAGIEIIGGGCFTSKYYSLGQILRYLESRGIRYGYESLPKPTLTPSKTLIPTATIVRYLAIGLNTDGIKSVVIEANTVCWGAKVGNIEYKVVRFQRSLPTPISITKGGCTYGQNLSAEDVFNYLRRVFNTPLSGFVDVR